MIRIEGAYAMRGIIIMALLLITSLALSGEIGVYQIFKSSFTTEQLAVADSYLKTEKFSEPVAGVRDVWVSSNTVIVTGDAGALARAASKLPVGNYKFIGTYSYSNRGYDRNSPSWKLVNDYLKAVSEEDRLEIRVSTK